MDAVSNRTDDTLSEDPKSGKKPAAAGTADKSISEDKDRTNMMNGNVSDKGVEGIATSSTRLEDILALGGERASLDVVNSGDTSRAQDTLVGGNKSRDFREDSTQSNVAVSSIQDDEAKTLEVLAKTEQEQYPNGDDDDDEDGSRDSDIFDEPADEDVQASVRPRRYELSYWPYHIKSAERLWTPEEREKSDDWQELWKLVIQFLCESPDAFNLWQQHYMDLDYEYLAYNVALSPLSVAAAYGIPGLVKILLDRGELAAAETEDGRSALWFGAISPNIEIITLLLEKGVSPNARKDFPPPFHNLLWRNPKLDFVSLMLEHGADCNITDPWGDNALHCVAACGSDVEVLEVILKAHNDINIPNASGETPLHVLMFNAQSVSLDMLRVLLENGADVNQDDKDSQSKSHNLTHIYSALTTSRAII